MISERHRKADRLTGEDRAGGIVVGKRVERFIGSFFLFSPGPLLVGTANLDRGQALPGGNVLRPIPDCV